MPLHGDAEECDKVHDEDGPEDGNIEEFEEGAGEGDQGGLRGGVPKFELWQAPVDDKGKKKIGLSTM